MSSDECQILEKTKARDFRCPCGKAYLSYAALFTHIKLKHGGSVQTPLKIGPWSHHKAKKFQDKTRKAPNTYSQKVNSLAFVALLLRKL